jgi:NAD(P)-dependent dehydrogenase (short-subunit alcohol dehydrogenase family)
MRRLAGKSALITGAGRGLGRAIALAFAAEGANVALSFATSADGAQSAAREAERLGVRALAVRADLADPAQISELAAAALEAFGRLDVLVNNAGLFSAKPFLETSDELWERLLTVNLSAPFRCARALVPAMLAAGGGVIINLASGGGQHPRPGYATSPAYAASKAGLIMLSKKLALELAPTIRVNCIAPGIVDSKLRPMSAAVRQKFAALTPLGRVGEPRNVADAAIFLASDESEFITGQVLNVDGGILM